VKPPPFRYFAPESADEALDLLAEHGDEGKVLAGGQSLIPLLALRLARPSALIDVSRLSELGTVEHDDGSLQVGATARHRSIERSDTVRDDVPLLAAAMPLIGHAAIRTRGTIGGSLAHADPSAELPAVALALDAELVARRAGGEARTIPARDFFEGFFTTALADDELLVAARFPRAAAGTGVCFEETARRHGDFAIVGAAVSLRMEGGRVTEPRIALTGVAEVPLRRSEAEAVLEGAEPSGDVFAAAGEAAGEGLEPASDLHGTGEYRRHLARVMVRRALHTAAERAGAKV
jgi:carbon-monoxide dehydrogenase medium subunit